MITFLINWSFILTLIDLETNHFQCKVLIMVSLVAVILLWNWQISWISSILMGKHDFTHVKYYTFNFTHKVWNSCHLTTLHILSIKKYSPSTSAPFRTARNRKIRFSFSLLFQVKCKGLKLTGENMKTYIIYMSKNSTDGAWHKGDSLVWVKEKFVQTFLHKGKWGISHLVFFWDLERKTSFFFSFSIVF